MKEISQNKQLASAVKRATLCAATTAMLTSAGIVSADHGHEHALLHDVEIKVGGYVKTDATYDLDADLGPSFAVSNIPTGSGTDSETSFRIHSLQSRLNFSATKDNMNDPVGSQRLCMENRRRQLRRNPVGDGAEHAAGTYQEIRSGTLWLGCSGRDRPD